MNRKQLIKKYIEFFKNKSHKEIKNSSLIPENDPTVLFTTAGMHPLVPYLLGEKNPHGKRLVNVQRCIRTQDIEEVGDSYHHTFFEMLGNWSLGDYWKKEAIEFSFEFLTKVLKIPKERLAFSCFKGDKEVTKDNETYEIWKELGISEERIVFLGRKENWWGPAGTTGPCGPDTEMFYWKLNDKPAPKKFDPKDDNWVEIWNDVLMEYHKDKKSYNPAIQKNIDTGMGVERTVSILNGLEDNYLSDSFLPLIKKIEKISKKKYNDSKDIMKSMRVIADHVKASVFIIGDGIVPGNSEQGYVLRRLIRRALRYGRNIGLTEFIKEVAEPVFKIYEDYKHLGKNKNKIISELENEEKKFLKTLDKGMIMFDKMIRDKKIDGKEAFLLYQSYGFPIEMTQELAKERKVKIDVRGFEKESKRHQELSKTASVGKFKSGLADESEETTKLHTATHLLHEALREVLGKEVEQKGSNITPERLRFDFSFDRKMTDEEKKKVEDLVNGIIFKKLEVSKKIMSSSEAKKSGALGFFEHKYGDKISVYTIGKGKKVYSKEICTGPHVLNTGDLGKFRIKKEESSSSGVRRIKGILE
jgi:alanyl-tRNA synthetase